MLTKLKAWVKLLFKKRESKKTVRFMFPAFLAFAALFSLANLTTSQSSYVRLEASKTTVSAGEQFTIDVFAHSQVPVNAVDITLNFDKNAVKVLGVDKGQSVLTIWTDDPIIEENRVILRGGTFRRGFLGEHKIATIDLQAMNTGLGTFAVSDVVLLAGDGSGTPVPVAEGPDSNISFYVYDENTDPEVIAVKVKVKIITDIDGDGKVSMADISAFMSAWGDKSVTYDFNSDGKMTFRDFSIILADFILK